MTSQRPTPTPASRGRAILQLIRVPNLVTAAADVLAGFLFVGARFDRGRELLALIGASVCLYAAGVVINDVCDARRDAQERPNRPIPSGAIKRSHAIVLGGVLLIAGCALCAVNSPRAGTLGLVLTACILLYNTTLKETPLAPPTMGLCRAINLLIGMSVVGAAPPAGLFAAGLMGLYITAVTHFARFEASTTSRTRLRTGSAGITVAVVGLVALQAFMERSDTWYLLLVGVMLGQVTTVARRAIATGAPADVQIAVKTFVLSLILFDGCLVFAARGPLLAALVLALILPAIALSRSLRVT